MSEGSGMSEQNGYTLEVHTDAGMVVITVPGSPFYMSMRPEDARGLADSMRAMADLADQGTR